MTRPDPATARDAPDHAVLVAHQLGFDHPGHTVFDRLDLRLMPGLSLLRGGDGRGKTTVLRVLAGEVPPTRGRIDQPAASCCLGHPPDASNDRTPAQAWLAAQARQHRHWNARLAADLVEGFALAEHLAKQVHMLSTGGRRKLGLVAAIASGAALTLLDTPYAAIDADAARLLSEVLLEAADDPRRAWLIADGERPKWLAKARWAGLIDLGD